ncbi:sigma-70 family RNA polymerase sigma factor [Sinosporangium siamense]|uniref:RNA polymerase sigma24 factor n=1 Tax=Sinosporangium siamense TaxID=1367973 RepID=A0A919RII2_9ACTN|nr:sigma-70 family RNA polymerase sigma factor [Sinosporangium siamense]GII94417.1 RNA polymerase sigma24 factor [Sinosporangium siamense]
MTAPPAATAPLVSGEGREAALTTLFNTHYTGLLRLAVLLGADDAEDIVAEAFCQLHRRWNRLRTAEAALPYLRSVVCNLTRMRLRRLQVARKHAARTAELERSAESVALLHDDQRALIEALGRLSARQREALVLRFWLGLCESDIADAMGISCGSVKTHTSRGMATLTKIMEDRR